MPNKPLAQALRAMNKPAQATSQPVNITIQLDMSSLADKMRHMPEDDEP